MAGRNFSVGNPSLRLSAASISARGLSKHSPSSVSISKFPTWEKKHISNRDLSKLNCVMEKSVDEQTHSVVNTTTPDCLNATNRKKEPSVSTLLVNLDDKFDPFDAMSTPLYQTVHLSSLLL